MSGELQPSLFDWRPAARDLAADGRSHRTEHDPAATTPHPAEDELRGQVSGPVMTTPQTPRTPQSESVRCGVEARDPAGSTPQGWTRAVSALEGRPAGSPVRGREDREDGIGGRPDRSLPRAACGIETGTGERPRLELRPYQVAGITAVEEQWRAGCRRTLLVLPTGTGKTRCFAELVRRCVARGKRALVVAHRTELLEQAQRHLAELGIRSAIERGKQRAGHAPVVIGSVQSLRGDRLAALVASEFGLLVVDEGHHATAEGYRAIGEHFAGIDVLLVTATADRADGRALGKICDSVAYRYEMREAIRDGWLVPVRAKRVHVAGLDLSRVRSHHGDLDQRELAAIMQREQALHGIVAPLLELAGDRRTIAFAVDVAHAHAIAELANRYQPGVAHAVDGSASDEERSAALVAFRRGDFRILVNCALYTEGFNEPSISCVALCRPTQSRALNTQMIGRGTRLLGLSIAESIANGKRDVLVLDFVGNVGKHKLVGPADALAGEDLPDDVRAAVDVALDGGQVELEDILAHAEREQEIRRSHVKLIALAHYRTTEIDPFFAELPPEPDGAWTTQPATPSQLKALVTAGFSRLPAALTRGEASRYIEALQERRKRGLVSLKAARRLHSLGIDTRNMTANRAGQLFAKLAKRGWRPWVLAHEPEYRRSK
jgi:superfamily II DNA or RNA helicase